MEDHTYTSRERKRRRSEQNRPRRRNQTRVNLGVLFLRWRAFKTEHDFATDGEVAYFLLDNYEKKTRTVTTSTPMKATVFDEPALSSIGGSSGTDREALLQTIPEKQEVECLAQSLLDVSIADEEEPNENSFEDLRNSVIEWADKEDRNDDSSDEEYVPPISLRFGGAMQNAPKIEQLSVIGLDETVHDLPSHDDTPETTEYPVTLSTLPKTPKVETADDIIGVRAALIYENCLKQLVLSLSLPVKKCPGFQDDGTACESLCPFNTKITTRGTAMHVEWVCENGHRLWSWSSQPVLKYGLQAGDFLLSTNILLSGNNYAKISLLLQFMNLGMVNRNTFFTIQDTYCVDTIKHFWNMKRLEEISRLQGKDVVLLGDARNDSPGHSAQYCSYTTMENDTKAIVQVVTVDKRQTNWNSNVMEKEAFIETIKTLSKELKVVEICTDAHLQIGALMNPDKGRFKDLGIHHSLDMWHGAKNLAKKIAAAGKSKGKSGLLHWLKDIVNHFWWCCKTADTVDEFMTLWMGVVHHVCGVHSWKAGSCYHGDLVDEDKTKWIQRDSECHKTLLDIILNKRWLKEVSKYLRFRSTADLESFQNHVLMYASKRHAFTPPVYEARVLLAALDYNCHRSRPLLTTTAGKHIYRRVYKKNARRYSLYTVRTGKTYEYVPNLQRQILASRLESEGGMPRRRSLRINDPRRLGVVPPLPPPSISELLQTQVSRGLGPAFQTAELDQ